MRRDAVALLEDLSRHQRPRPSQSVPRHRAVLVRRRHRDPGAAADVSLETSNNWPASLRPGGLRQVADNLSISGCETFIYSICLNEFPTTSNRFSRFTFFAFYTLIWEETALLRRLQPTFPAPQNADAENVEV